MGRMGKAFPWKGDEEDEVVAALDAAELQGDAVPLMHPCPLLPGPVKRSMKWSLVSRTLWWARRQLSHRFSWQSRQCELAPFPSSQEEQRGSVWLGGARRRRLDEEHEAERGRC